MLEFLRVPTSSGANQLARCSGKAKTVRVNLAFSIRPEGPRTETNASLFKFILRFLPFGRMQLCVLIHITPG